MSAAVRKADPGVPAVLIAGASRAVVVPKEEALVISEIPGYRGDVGLGRWTGHYVCRIESCRAEMAVGEAASGAPCPNCGASDPARPVVGTLIVGDVLGGVVDRDKSGACDQPLYVWAVRASSAPYAVRRSGRLYGEPSVVRVDADGTTTPWRDAMFADAVAVAGGAA